MDTKLDCNYSKYIYIRTQKKKKYTLRNRVKLKGIKRKDKSFERNTVLIFTAYGRSPDRLESQPERNTKYECSRGCPRTR
jgi:hypothetical protein